ncbi:MAG: glycosyl hydrolase, partial [Chloroflexota bacterium]
VYRGGFGHSPVEGANYRFASGLMVAFDRHTKPDGEVEVKFLDAGENPPDGVLIHYHLDGDPGEKEVTITISDDEGNEIKTFSSKAEEDNLKLRPVAGGNRFVWDMRYPDAATIEGDEIAKTFITGPKATPGRYSVALSVDGKEQSATFEIVPDPRSSASADDYAAQFDLQIKVRDKISAVHETVEAIRKVREQVDSWVERVETDEVKNAADDLKEKLDEIEGNLVQIKAKGPKDRLKFPVKENAKLNGVMNAAASAEGRPTRQTYDLFDEISERVDAQIEAFEELKSDGLQAFNKLLQEQEAPAIGD